ncbi:type IV secretory system conjugative DNA transfer family protein [Cerasicoccus arenae]|uniref:TraD/TraG TraM recognition site domain-containing protein n=1 Tax=Cerasicoccus arenae TaxID=424488 RepID=A0A8J3GFI2_9BACT|nr:hypothetical protein [Cerasicoccus arenae]MBK1857767.1 hypothetical protein [Cerasicoccus arenae]GHC11940.1 hypothetical protein GCM10007047_31630 [Cerasicoccus arenae]
MKFGDFFSRGHYGATTDGPPPAKPFSLDWPLLQIGPNDWWTVRDACEGTQIFGATGSGKTSGSGRAIARQFLRSGFGGLVLTVKRDEKDLWLKYCAETGRSDSVILVSADLKECYNILSHESKRSSGQVYTETIMGIFNEVIDIVDRFDGEARDEKFWVLNERKLLRNAIELLLLGHGKVSIKRIENIIHSGPRQADEAYIRKWSLDSLCGHTISKAEKYAPKEDRVEDLHRVKRFWLHEFAGMNEKTRDSILLSITARLDRMNSGPLQKLFSTETTFTPEMTFNGAIIILDFSVKEHGDLGIYVQAALKYCWQKAVERRTVNESTRPVFLWCDESQFFANKTDQAFQTTARSAKAATVYLTQNLPNYYTMLGGKNPQDTTNSLLGNFQTKIFHQNTCNVTNAWAAELIAKVWQTSASEGYSDGEKDQDGKTRKGSFSWGRNPIFEYDITPRDFTTLKKGGPANELMVEAVFYPGGRLLSNKKPFSKVLFNQTV